MATSGGDPYRRSGEYARVVAERMERLAKSVGQAADQMDKLARKVAGAFAGATAAVTGWVRAGLAGTVEGFRLRYAFELLSQEIAGAFLPVVDRLTRGILNLRSAMGRLTADQQQQIAKVGLMTAAFTASLAVIGGPLGLAVGALAAGLSVVALSAERTERVMKMLRDPATEVGSRFGDLLVRLDDLGEGLADFGEKFMEVLGPSILSAVTHAVEQLTVALKDLQGVLSSLDTNIGGGALGEVFGAIGNISTGPIWNMPERIWDDAMERGRRLHNNLYGTDIGAGDFSGDPGAGGDFGGGRGRRVPTRLDVGYESAIDTFKRIAAAGLKTELEKKQEEQADDVKGIRTTLDAWAAASQTPALK